MYCDILLVTLILLVNFCPKSILIEGIKDAFTITKFPERSSALQRFLSAHKTSSRFECLHRCQRRRDCKDAVMTGDGECWLLGNGKNESGVMVGGYKEKKIKELLTPHIVQGLHVMRRSNCSAPIPPGTSLFWGLPRSSYHYIFSLPSPN